MSVSGRVEVRAAGTHTEVYATRLTESSMKSAWVESEVEAAFEKERKQKRTVLFPIQLDVAVMEAEEAWAVDIRTRNIGDFRGWKEHDKYKKAFERLLKDLKAE